MDAKTKMAMARKELVLDVGSAFWGSLSLKLKIIEDKTCPTCWTDGQVIGYNPDYIDKCSLLEVVGLMAHEAGGHCANLHPFRRGDREPKLWNEACDYAINPILIKAKFKLPGQPLVDARFNGMSAESIYSVLFRERQAEREQQRQEQQAKQQAQEQQKGQGQGAEDSEDDSEDSNEDSDLKDAEDPQDGEPDDNSEPSGETETEDEPEPQPGEVRDAQDGDDSEDGQAGESKGMSKDEQEADWQSAVLNAAAIAQGEGKLPAGLERLIDEIKHPKIDWKAALRKFFETCAKNDYSWKQPNRRYIASGLFLPSLKSEQIGLTVIYGDMSGSRFNNDAVNETLTEVAGILNDVRPEKTIYITADSEVTDVQEFTADDEVVFKKAKGGGGTDFQCVFDWIRDNLEDEPVCFVGITDLMGSFPDVAPDYPVIWCSTTRIQPPFGETIEL